MTLDKTPQLAEWTYSIPESEIRRLLRYSPKYYFAGGKPGALPLTPFREILQRLADETLGVAIKNYGEISTHQLLDYGRTEGSPELRKVLAARLRLRDNIPLDSDEGWKNVIITSGSQQTLYALLDVLIRPRDIVMVTRPSYLGFVTPAVKLGADLISLPTDDHGLLPEAVETACIISEKEYGTTPKLLYVVPFSDNPKGTTLPNSRKSELYNLAEQWDFLIAEDVAYKEIRFGQDLQPIHPIKELDKENNRVAYFSTTTKEAASLRLGYSVFPTFLKDSIIKTKGYLDLCSPSLTQEIARIYYEEYIDNWLPRVVKVYEERSKAMIEAVDEYMPFGTHTYPQGGFFIWFELENREFDTKLFQDSNLDEVLFVPGHTFFPLNGWAIDDTCTKKVPQISKKNTMRIGYSLMAPDLIRKGIKRLAQLITTYESRG